MRCVRGCECDMGDKKCCILNRCDTCVRMYRQMAKSATHRTADEKKKTTPPRLHLLLGQPAFHLIAPPPEPAPSFRCQTNGFAMLHKGVVTPEGSPRGSGGHCMTRVTRYLLVSREEKETNNDLKSSSLESDRPSGLYNRVERL